jgi:hypothetical protein
LNAGNNEEYDLGEDAVSFGERMDLMLSSDSELSTKAAKHK